MKTVRVNIPEREYDITIGRGILSNLSNLLNLKRRVFILTDSGVPKEYAEAVAAQCEKSTICTVPMGEGAKSISIYEEVLSRMLEFNMTRKDCLVAVGGGVVGDLGGFASATYMRGIDFYNVPTTLLADVDSSIGGKTAINLKSTKNVVGAFHQPKAVVIDVDTLKTLDKRLINEGLAEALKMSLTSDPSLFAIFESDSVYERLEEIIVMSLMIKKDVVEKDEKESGLRKILNFGHTLGHAIEAEESLNRLYHGECVALGMIPMCSLSVRERLIKVLKKLSLPTEYKMSPDDAIEFISHDKKCYENSIEVIFVNEIGKYEIKKMTLLEYKGYIADYFSN